MVHLEQGPWITQPGLIFTLTQSVISVTAANAIKLLIIAISWYYPQAPKLVFTSHYESII